jgi:hypothetical protein
VTDVQDVYHEGVFAGYDCPPVIPPDLARLASVLRFVAGFVVREHVLTPLLG